MAADDRFWLDKNLWTRNSPNSLWQQRKKAWRLNRQSLTRVHRRPACNVNGTVTKVLDWFYRLHFSPSIHLHRAACTLAARERKCWAFLCFRFIELPTPRSRLNVNDPAPQIFQFSYRSRAFRCLRRCSARLGGEISLSLSRLENKSRSGLISVRALMGKQEKREKFHSTWRRAALTSWKNVTLCHKNSLFISQLFAIVEVVR